MSAIPCPDITSLSPWALYYSVAALLEYFPLQMANSGFLTVILTHFA